jgi:hypothetical protein
MPRTQHLCIHWPSSLGSLLPLPSCRCHPRAIAEGLECFTKGHWLMMMERRAARNNPDNDDRALLLPLPSPSSAHMVAVVLLVWTLFDYALPSPCLSSCHHLPPTFLIVECLHHWSIATSIFVDFCTPPILHIRSTKKMIFMGHQILSSHVSVVRSFFIYFKIISSS